MHAVTTLPAVLGTHTTVPVDGGFRTYAHLDHAATAPCLQSVREAVDTTLDHYGSVHRGAGHPSQVTSRAYAEAREDVRAFLGGPQAVVFVRNTTDAFNLLARALPQGTSVVVFESEHHSAQLPWRGAVRLPVPPTPDDAVAMARDALASLPLGPRLLVVTAASNVTGELWPVRALTEVAHSCGARIAVDAAQFAAHRPFDFRDVDYVALSGHKLYAPFGTGVLAGRADWLRAAPPYLRGGGSTSAVDRNGPTWQPRAEARHEGGTPNVVGAVALAAACRALSSWDSVIDHETRLLGQLRAGLSGISGVRELSLWGASHPRVGISSFVVAGHRAEDVAEHLAARHGIGVRAGRFCAHPLVNHLTGGSGGCATRDGAAVRASIGLGSTEEHVHRLVSALDTLPATLPAAS